MSGVKVSALVNAQQNAQIEMRMVGPDWKNPRYSYTFDGEEIAVVLDRTGVVSKEFTPMLTVEKLRRYWRRLFRSESPF